MKFNSKTAKEIGTTGGSAIVGTKISKAVNEVVPANWKNPGTHGLIMLLGIGVAAFIPGKGIGSQVVRGLALGVAIDQGNEATNQVIAPMLPEADTKAKVLLNASFGKPTTGVQGYRSLRAAYSPAVNRALENSNQFEDRSVVINVSE